MKLKCIGSSSKGNCYLLIGKKETLIIEAGIAFNEVKKALNFNVSNVVGCIVSHEHKDHSRSMLKMAEAGIKVFCTKGSSPFEAYFYIREILLYRKPINIGSFAVLPLKAIHDAGKPASFVIYHHEMGALLFITDTGKFNFKVPEVNHLLIEANFDKNLVIESLLNGSRYNNLERLSASHMSIDECEKVVSRNLSKETKNIVLLHLSDGNSNADDFKSRIRKLTGKPVYVADENLEIEL